MGADATVDPRPGGVFRVVFHPTADVAAFISASGGATGEVVTNAVLGEFVAVDPYERIAFTWGYENELFAMPPQSTAVEVSLTPASGGTVLRLGHRAPPEAGGGLPPARRGPHPPPPPGPAAGGG